MKLNRLLITTSLCAVVTLPATAQQARFGDVDTDGNGRLSQSELEAAFGSAGAAQILLRRDADSDGGLTRAELRGGDDEEGDDEEDDDERFDDEEDDDEENDDESYDDEEDDDEEDDEEDDDEEDDDDDGESSGDEDDED